MRNDVCKLITLVPEGTEIVPHESGIFCEVKSVSRSEFFAAYAAGLSPKLTFGVNPDDYRVSTIVRGDQKYRPSQIRYDGERFTIIRTYQKSAGEMEITAG